MKNYQLKNNKKKEFKNKKNQYQYILKGSLILMTMKKCLKNLDFLILQILNKEMKFIKNYKDLKIIVLQIIMIQEIVYFLKIKKMIILKYILIEYINN